MAFAGLRGTGNWGTSERPQNFRELILWQNPNGKAPLTALMAKSRKESVDDPQFHWWEEKLKPMRAKVNFTTGFATTDNTITIAAEAAGLPGTATSGGLNFVAGDVLQIEKTETATYDNEQVVVSSVTSDTVIVIKRGQAGTTAAPLLHGVWMTKLGPSYEEGSTSPSVSTRNPTKLTNYAQLFKTAVGITETGKLTYARTGDAWVNDKKRKAFDHAAAMEFQWMFGVPYEDTGGTYPKWYTGGLRYFITTNVKIFTTTPTEDTLLDALYPVFNYDSEAGDERVVLAGNGFLNALNRVARTSSSTRINFDGILTVYGMNLQKWVTPQGTFGVRSHPLMNLHGRYMNSAFVIDPSNLRYRYMIDTKFEDNIQANDSDTRKGQWKSHCGLEVNHEDTMAYLGNVTVP